MSSDDNAVKRRRISEESEEEDDFANELRRQNVDQYEENDAGYGSNPDEVEGRISDDEGEDLAEHWLDDYAPAPELDQYDEDLLAQEEEDMGSYADRIRNRMAADIALDAMDARRRAQAAAASDGYLERVTYLDRREMAAGLLDEDDLDEEEEEMLQAEALAAEAAEAALAIGEDPDAAAAAVLGDGPDRTINLETFDCPLREWIAEERTRREIQRRFRLFLTKYHDIEFQSDNPDDPLPPHLAKKTPLYSQRIRAMCAENKSSLEVSYQHLSKMQSLLAIWLTDIPRDMLQIFDEVLCHVVRDNFPHYSRIARDLHVRITDLPIADKLRDLRQSDLNNFVRVTGVVTRRTGVFPQLISVTYDCPCGASIGPFNLNGGVETRPTVCANCGERGPFRVNQKRTTYGNYQRLTLQESPGSVPPGRVPRYKDVVLTGDLVDAARPGEEIDITGIYCNAQQFMVRKANGFPVFATLIEANCIQKRQAGINSTWTDDDKRKILALSKDPQICERLIRSIAPSIYGHRHVKTAIALSLFGGCHKSGDQKAGMHRVRGDINILLLGDPGTAKSQILKYCEKTAPRSVYTTGKGASAVGLTAGVHKDPITKEWTLEGGALVLADQGVCLIDEFDKMNEQDRTSIHEAMEQQTISVSKAGIVTSLQARCSVVAAANPIGGRYDPSYSFAENVELTDPILQRFDVLCVLQDIVDPVADEKLAHFVVNSHIRSHADYSPELGIDIQSHLRSDASSEGMEEGHMMAGGVGEIGGPEPVDQSLLKKYIAYARTFVRPVLLDVDSEKIAQLYAELRAQSAITGGVPIAVRHIESIVRLSEASARMHLRDHVRRDDVDLAIKVVLEAFLQSQKISARKALQRSFRKYLTYGEDSNLLLLHQLQRLMRDAEKFKHVKRETDPTEIYVDQLAIRARELRIFDLAPFFKSSIFRSYNFVYDERRAMIRRLPAGAR